MEEINGVAIKIVKEDGYPETWASPRPDRHHHVIHKMKEAGISTETIAYGIQGFTTSKGRFVNRYQALAIARNVGQLLEGALCPNDELYSEGVW